MTAITDIQDERIRQQTEEGWTEEHDDHHELGELAAAAGCYCLWVGPQVPDEWPWDAEWWKPKDRRRDLVRAGALIVAEIERIDREAARIPPDDARN